MVEEVGYNARVRVQAGAALPGVSPDSYGAGLGQAISQTGAVIQQEQLEDARLDRELRDNREWSAALVADAKAREELSALAREGRESDAPGHAARIAEEVKKREEALLGMVTSQRLKQQMQARVAEWGGSIRTREADYEAVRGQEIAIEAFAEQRGIAEGRVRRLDKPDDYRLELKLQVDAINALSTSDKIKQQLIDETEQRLAVAFLRGVTDRDPQAAQAFIDSGAFDGVITGDQVEVLRNGTQVEIRRVEGQRREEQAAAVAAVKTQIGLFLDLEKAGAFGDEADYDQWIAKAAATGDPALVVQLELLKKNRDFTRIFGPENMGALQREQELAALAAKPNRSEDENLALKFLQDRAPEWAAQEREDPVGRAAMRGGANPPPIANLNDPGSIRAAGQWAAGQGSPERPVPAFSKQQMFELDQMFDSGPAGQTRVLDILGNLPAPVAMETARRLDTGMIALPVMATLRPELRKTALRGASALKANPKMIRELQDADTSGDLEKGIALARAKADAAMQAEGIHGQYRASALETARYIVAGEVEKGRPLTPALYRSALKQAMNARMNERGEWEGGFGEWGDRWFRLPKGVTEKGFSAAVVRGVQQSKNGPVNPDGSPFNLFKAYPVQVEDGVYEFRSASGKPVLRADRKTPYRLHVRAR